MAQPRTFDYDYLRDLFRAHPEWSNRQYAEAVTEHEREVYNDPTRPRITPHAIASVKLRYQDQWRANGVDVNRTATDPTKRRLPFKHVPAEYQSSYLIQCLRNLSKLAEGENISERKAREAEGLARRLTSEKSVVDVSYKGQPYVRKARLDELDGEGNLISFAAKYPGLTDTQWEALQTPQARAAASAQWRP